MTRSRRLKIFCLKEWAAKMIDARIKEPTNISEFEVHAYVWTELRSMGINARGEVKVPFATTENRRAVCRFDIGIFEDGFLAGIIEIKAGETSHKTEAGWLGTRQGSRYSTFGVPVAIIYGKNHADKFVALSKLRGSIVWEYARPA